MSIAKERGADQAASYQKHVLNEMNRIARGDVPEAGRLAGGIPAPFQQALRRLSATVHSYRSAAETERERDRLTGLLRGAAFRQRVAAQIGQLPPDTGAGVLLILYLKGLNRINETLGRHAGDRALALAAGRLTAGLNRAVPGNAAVPPVIGRLGGDKFGMFVEGASLAWAQRCAQMLRVALNEPFFFESTSVIIGGSIGIAAWPEHGGNCDTLFQSADSALREAKAAGGNLCVTFDESIRQRARMTAATEAMLPEALNSNQLELYFQPQLRISRDDTPAAEALLRWNHPERGVVMPQDFLPLAERAGLMNDRGDRASRTSRNALPHRGEPERVGTRPARFDRPCA
jgi:diguanylate cyclase